MRCLSPGSTSLCFKLARAGLQGCDMIALADTLGITENCPPYKKIREQSPEADSVLREMISLINAIYLPSNQTLLLLSPTASQCDTAGFFTHLALITVGWRGIDVPDSISVACSAYVLCKSQFNSQTVTHTVNYGLETKSRASRSF